MHLDSFDVIIKCGGVLSTGSIGICGEKRMHRYLDRFMCKHEPVDKTGPITLILAQFAR